MEIDPSRQLAMLMAALFCGACFGLVFELRRVVRILLGLYCPHERMRSRYARPLPLLKRPVPFDKKGAGKRGLCALLVGVGDVLFCISFALCCMLILYAYNSGELRLSVFCIALLGFAVLRRFGARLIERPADLLAFGLAAAFCYIRALLAGGAKGLLRLLKLVTVVPFLALFGRIMGHRRRRISAKLCARELALATLGLSGDAPLDVKEKGRKSHVKKKNRRQDDTRPMGDPHSDPDHICGGTRHRCQPADGVESAPST
ncbi:MAG: spore cortex biosynthesis protein YabQ [Clostridia bacterium]|nr:spore cortex biosynthesis protein YabQ [Clostridia bacterium]